MNIRYKLSIQFTSIVVSILLILTIGIYYFSSSYRRNESYTRLKERANTTARLFLDVKAVDKTLLKIIDKNTLELFHERVDIINENNEQIYCNLEDSTFNNPLILYKVRKNGIYEFRQDTREAIGILYYYNYQEYVVIASSYDFFGIAKIKNLKIILIIGFLLSVFITIAAGLIFSGRALAPISTVVAEVNNITISNLNSRVNEGNKKDEIAKLAITFNQMLQRLEEAFILQRDFVSNAAHELRTPFTVMLAEIDYSLLQVREKEQYINTLVNLSKELKKLSRLSNGLLDLARISYDNSNFELATFRFDELLVETCHDILKTNSDYKTKINFDEMPENESYLNIKGNEQLLKIAIKNLIENACKFSDSKTVNILLSFKEKFVTIKFCDDGIGIPKEEISRIFQPFYRGTNTQFIAGYGLGLALTMKVVQLHNGQIEVESEENKGSVFTLTLPNGINS
jgi:signal transduction histidine kinase